MDRKHQLCALIERYYQHDRRTHRALAASKATWQRIRDRGPQLTYTLLLRILAHAGYTTRDYYALLHADHRNYPWKPRSAVLSIISTGLKTHTIQIIDEENKTTTRRTQYILVSVFGLLFCLFSFIALYGIITL